MGIGSYSSADTPVNHLPHYDTEGTGTHLSQLVQHPGADSCRVGAQQVLVCLSPVPLALVANGPIATLCVSLPHLWRKKSKLQVVETSIIKKNPVL